MNVLIGMVAKLPAKSLKAWASSFRRSAGEAPRVILLAQPAKDYSELELYNIEIRDRSDLWLDPKDPQSICKDRWPVLAETIRELPANDKVLVTDVRDAIFQRDPFEQIRDFGVTVATEGVYIRENGWGRDLVKQHNLPKWTLDCKMICAGVWAAPASVAAALCEQVYLMAKDYPGGVDQHCLDYVLGMQQPGAVHAIPYSEAWTCHCSLMYGQQSGERFEEKPTFDKGVMLSKDKPFAIVHHVWPGRWLELKPLLEQA